MCGVVGVSVFVDGLIFSFRRQNQTHRSIPTNNKLDTYTKQLMVRGNWQKRVETAEARRQLAKSKKQRSELYRLYKRQYHEFVSQLVDCSINGSIRMYCDVLPVNDSNYNNGDDDGPPGKPRSSSMEYFREDESSPTTKPLSKKKGRHRSNSESSSGKKVHPRSHQNTNNRAANEDTTTATPIWMCENYFYSGKCSNLKKKPPCGYRHNTTLCPHTSGATIASMRQARVDDNSESPLHAMEPVFMIGDASLRMVDETRLSELLSCNQIKPSNVVYILINETLVFDRFQEGSLLQTKSVQSTLIGGGGSPKTNRHDFDVSTLSSIVLQHILLFCPDNTISMASQVCRHWHYEIGTNSPNLWQSLLDRHNWPTTTNNTNAQESFIVHYKVLRDIQGLANGLRIHMTVLNDFSARSNPHRGVAVHHFGFRNDGPPPQSSCVGCAVWGPNRVLTGYSADCSVRLFESTATHGCKQVLCHHLDPYTKTKRRHCHLLRMELDEECVAGLCSVYSQVLDLEAYILVVMRRDDLLESAGEEDILDLLTVIDIGEATLNYLLCSEEESRLRLVDFLSQGGDLADAKVQVSRSLGACGYSRFLLEASISIPLVQDDGSITMMLIDRRLFLFSASVSSIVWMGEPLVEQRAVVEEMVVTCLRKPWGGSHSACWFAVGSRASPAIELGEIEPSGNVTSLRLLEASLQTDDSVEAAEWTVLDQSHNPLFPNLLLVSVSDVIGAENYTKSGQEDQVQSVVTFYNRLVKGPSREKLVLPRVTLAGMFLVGHAYVVFVSSREEGILVHIPSRTEIGRATFVPNDSVRTEVSPFRSMIVSTNGTLGLAFAFNYVVLTGDDVRTTQGSSTSNVASPQSTKKKKKRQPNRGGKKDGYARGMSLRG